MIFSVIRLPKARSLSSTNGNFDAMDIEDDESIDHITGENIDEIALRPDQIPWTFEHVERPGELAFSI